MKNDIYKFMLVYKLLTRARGYQFSVFEEINADSAKTSKYGSRNFIDQLKLRLVSGRGGNGAESYFTSKT